MGKKENSEKLETSKISPGPGTYQVKSFIEADSMTNIKFGSAERFKSLPKNENISSDISHQSKFLNFILKFRPLFR